MIVELVASKKKSGEYVGIDVLTRKCVFFHPYTTPPENGWKLCPGWVRDKKSLVGLRVNVDIYKEFEKYSLAYGPWTLVRYEVLPGHVEEIYRLIPEGWTQESMLQSCNQLVTKIKSTLPIHSMADHLQ